MQTSNESYKIELANIYSGPLDLLLYLVKKNEIAIHEISISRVTEQYLQYIELLQKLDVNIASEFLVMAATLMHVKSRSLLPPSEDVENEEDEDDPKFELIQQLLEYKKYKDLAAKLGEKEEEASKKFSRPKIDFFKEDKNDIALEIGDVSVWDLLDKFSNLMKETLMDEPSVIKDEDKPVSRYMDELMDKVDNSPSICFHDLFVDLRTKMAMIGFFLALLELVRMKKLKVYQESVFNEIKISKHLEEIA
ncbi:MAG: segregation and condensation protein A [Candidatus Anammoxibacter sp.]